jgi:hypothetical protein
MGAEMRRFVPMMIIFAVRRVAVADGSLKTLGLGRLPTASPACDSEVRRAHAESARTASNIIILLLGESDSDFESESAEEGSCLPFL